MISVQNKKAVCALLVVSLICAPGAALAYGGPGMGLGFLAVIFGLVSATAVALFGFVWYPLKRQLAKWRKKNAEAAPEEAPRV